MTIKRNFFTTMSLCCCLVCAGFVAPAALAAASCNNNLPLNQSGDLRVFDSSAAVTCQLSYTSLSDRQLKIVGGSGPCHALLAYGSGPQTSFDLTSIVTTSTDQLALLYDASHSYQLLLDGGPFKNPTFTIIKNRDDTVTLCLCDATSPHTHCTPTTPD